jgi:hypothetical protein
MSEEIEAYFPSLQESGYEITSPPTPEYNCIAWAAGNDDVWGWPDPFEDFYWPSEAQRIETLEAFVQAFGLDGYHKIVDTSTVPIGNRVAIFVDRQGIPTHASRQLPNGRWTSKLGQLEDIEHYSLDGLEGSVYGTVAVILEKSS